MDALLNEINTALESEVLESIYAEFGPLVQQQNMGARAHARRVVLAAQKGGKCNACKKEMPDRVHFGRAAPYENRYEFDHIFPREFPENKRSPRTGILQFPISGTDCARRSYELVQRHALLDTQLLCKRCHDYHTNERNKWMERRNGAQLADFYREVGLPLPPELDYGQR